MPDTCKLIQVSIHVLQARICINNEETEDLMQRVDLNAFNELTRLHREHDMLVTRVNALCAELEEILPI